MIVLSRTNVLSLARNSNDILAITPKKILAVRSSLEILKKTSGYFNHRYFQSFKLPITTEHVLFDFNIKSPKKTEQLDIDTLQSIDRKNYGYNNFVPPLPSFYDGLDQNFCFVDSSLYSTGFNDAVEESYASGFYYALTLVTECVPKKGQLVISKKGQIKVLQLSDTTITNPIFSPDGLRAAVIAKNCIIVVDTE